MKKHSLAMVFLLILTLSLISAVSASENVTCMDDSLNQAELQMEIIDDSQNCQSICEEEPVLLQSVDECYCDEGSVLSQQIDENVLSKQVNVLSDYELGYELTDNFLNSNDFKSGELLVIATFEINEQNHDVFNGIMDASKGHINDDNLMSLSGDCETLGFFAKNTESVTIALYGIESMTTLYYGNAGPEYSDGILDFKSWAIGFMENFDFTNCESVSAGLESGQDLVQTFKNYPQFEFNLPLEDTLGVSRDFNDDAFILQKSQDESASVDVFVVNKSVAGFSNLNLESAKMETLNVNGLSLYEIGVKASEKAIKYFKSQGIDIHKDYPHLYVMTSAGFVKLNGKDTRRAIDGLLGGLGRGFDFENLKSADGLSGKDLVFYFIYPKSKTVYALKCINSKSGTSVKSEPVVSNAYVNMTEAAGQNMTNKTEKVNRTQDRNSTEESFNESVDVEVPKSNVNPFNIAYTIAAILIVCVIFANGYRKR